jgi:hypothetical protein
MLGVAAAAALAIAAPTGAAPNGNACEGGVKIEDPADGTYGSITLVVDEATQTFTFTSDLEWASVVVKGGPGEGLTFDAADPPAEGFHAPVNPKSGSYYGLSHVCFFPPDGGGGGGGEGGGEE